VYKNILIPTDGSDFAQEAIGHAVDLAKLLGAKITGVTVTPSYQVIALEGVVVSESPEQFERWSKDVSEARLSIIRRAAQAAGVPCEVIGVENDHPYAGIIEAAKTKGCDLIVMASHGRRGVSALLLGSETQKVLTHTDIPVLVYRPAER